MMRGIIFSLLFCISQPIYAGEREEIIVLGDKLPSPALDNPYGAIVITKEEMEGYQVSFLQDVLTKTGVADFYQSGGKGTFSDIYLRGLGSKYVKLLYDGIILNNPYSQQAAFSHLAAGGLSHIEIVKGSEGVLYGSETIGGAIHAHSAIGGEGSGQFSHERGSFATQNSRLSLQGERGDIAYGLGAGFYQTKGFSALDIVPSQEKDGYHNGNVNARVQRSLAPGLEMGLVVLAGRNRVDYDGYGSDFMPADLAGEFSRVQYSALRANMLFIQNDVSHELSIMDIREEASHFSKFAFSVRTEGSRQRVEYQGRASPREGKLLFGASWEGEEISSKTANDFFAKSAENKALWLFWQKGGISLAWRGDQKGGFASSQNWQASWNMPIKESVHIRGSLATGLRSPSLSELYDPQYGNVQLEPEQSDSVEIALRLSPSALPFMVTIELFRIEIDSLIEWVSIGNFQGQYQQIAGTTVSKGAEISAEWEISDAFSASLFYSYLDIRDATHKPLIRRARHRAGVSLDYRTASEKQFGLTLRARDYIPALGGGRLDDSALFSAYMRIPLKGALHGFARVENLFDADYQTAKGFRQAGREIYIGLEWKW